MARNSAPDVEFFAEICKVDEEQRTVFGYASTDCRDRQGEIVTKAAIAAALPDYMIWKNVREMHQPSAVGRAVEATMDDKGLYFGAYVADDRAWKKVKDKIYKGFSIGGRVTARDPDDKTIVTGVNITEISLVDRPANPEAKFDWFKRADDHLVFSPAQYWGCGCKDHQHLAKAEAQECMADQAVELQKRLNGGALLKFNQNHVDSGPNGGQFADGSGGGDGKDKEAMIHTQYGKRPAKNAETGKDAGKFQLKLASGRSPRAGPIAGKEGVHQADHFVDQYGNMHHVGKDGKMHEVQKLDEIREILKEAYADAEAMSKIDDDGFDTESGEFMGKRDFSVKERERAASTGAAMPGGGYPIENTSDLHNAIQAYGRAKDPDATKRHIISRAKALGVEKELPEDWQKGDKPEDGDDGLSKATPRHIEGGRFAGHVKSAQEAEGMAKQYSDLGDKAQKLHDKHMALANESDKAGNPAGASAHRKIAAAHKLNASRHHGLAKKYTNLANKHGEWANPNPGNGNDAVTVAKRAFASQLSKTKFTLAA